MKWVNFLVVTIFESFNLPLISPRSRRINQDWGGWPCSIKINWPPPLWPHLYLKQYWSKQWESVLPQEMGFSLSWPECLGRVSGIQRSLPLGLDMQESGDLHQGCLALRIAHPRACDRISGDAITLGTSAARFTKPLRTDHRWSHQTF